MEPIKTSENVEFEVIYADGSRRRVREGILFEAEGKDMTIHNGTDRKEVLFTVPFAAIETIYCAGLEEEFDKYAEGYYEPVRRAKHEKNN